jgi:hypothetical protein
MSLLGDRSASFIIRIWREERDGADRELVWRGSIENVRSDDKIYFKELAVIEEFIKTHLRAIGIDLDSPGAGTRMNLPPAAER